MDNVIQLPGELHRCPLYWINFIKHYVKHYKIVNSVELDTMLNSEFNATIGGNLYDGFKITFKKPEHKTWFIFKWS